MWIHHFHYLHLLNPRRNLHHHQTTENLERKDKQKRINIFMPVHAHMHPSVWTTHFITSLFFTPCQPCQPSDNTEITAGKIAANNYFVQDKWKHTMKAGMFMLKAQWRLNELCLVYLDKCAHTLTHMNECILKLCSLGNPWMSLQFSAACSALISQPKHFHRR